eukprot:scaffold27909_cov73-Isochrysis_galbana.AAC.1
MEACRCPHTHQLLAGAGARLFIGGGRFCGCGLFIGRGCWMLADGLLICRGCCWLAEFYLTLPLFMGWRRWEAIHSPAARWGYC